MEHQGDDDTNCDWHAVYNSQNVVKGQENLKIRVQVETILTTALLRSDRILRGVLKI